MPITYDNLRMFGMFGLKCFEFEETENGFFPVVPSDVVARLVLLFVGVGLVGYLLGTLNFAIIISKRKYKDDIRSYGSGNAGMTNMMRTYGKKTGALTFVLDLLKAVLAAVIGWFLLGEAGGYFAGLCCVLGHAFPVWYGFKGGKGVAVMTGVVFTLEPLLGLVLLVIFVLVVVFTRYISLGSIMAVLAYPVLLNNFYRSLHNGNSPFYFVVMSCAMISTVLVLFLHRSNMRRILDHTENKFSFKSKGEKKEQEQDADGK